MITRPARKLRPTLPGELLNLPADLLDSRHIGRIIMVDGHTPARLTDYKRGFFKTTLFLGGRVIKVRNATRVVA